MEELDLMRRILLIPHNTCTKLRSMTPVVSNERMDVNVTASDASGLCHTESGYTSSLIKWIWCR